MSDHKDPPIVPQDYLAGTTVVDIGDIRVARGMSRRPSLICRHLKLVYDNQERRIWCRDCETNIEAFDAFQMLVDRAYAAYADIKKRKAEVAAAEQHALISRAAKAADKAWRGRMVPACPHCRRGILPEDALQFSFTNREWEEKLREHKPK